MFDNARPHTAAHTVGSLHQLKSEVPKLPLYGRNVPPSCYQPSGPLKDALRGRRFASDLEVKAVQARLFT
jgi:hypothetical protein